MVVDAAARWQYLEHAIKEDFAQALAFLRLKNNGSKIRHQNTLQSLGLISLIICTKVNQLIVTMADSLNEERSTKKLMRFIIILVSIEVAPREAEVISYNLEYTFYKYGEIIKQIGLTSDFFKVVSYFRRRKMVKLAFDYDSLEHESDFRIILSAENKQWMD